MFQSILDDIKREFSYGNMVTRLIIINCIVFVVLNLLWIVFRIGSGWGEIPFFDTLTEGLMISTDWKHNLTKPWVIITPMFMHLDFFHILWNMLLLYWFGRIAGDFLGNHRVLPIYILGGLAGSIAFFTLYNVLPALSGLETRYALGASAAVMAIIIAAAVTSPDYIMYLLFIGGVKLKYIAAVLVFLDLIGVANNSNTGGRIAHIGGALMGWFFVTQLRKGNDWSIPINNIVDRIANFFNGFKGSAKVVDINRASKNQSKKRKAKSTVSGGESSKQARVDKILDKIKESGYDSLTDEEKKFLSKASDE